MARRPALLAILAARTQAPSPAFEVASIKPADLASNGTSNLQAASGITTPGGETDDFLAVRDTSPLPRTSRLWIVRR